MPKLKYNEIWVQNSMFLGFWKKKKKCSDLLLDFDSNQNSINKMYFLILAFTENGKLKCDQKDSKLDDLDHLIKFFKRLVSGFQNPEIK